MTYYNSTFNVDDTTPAIDVTVDHPNCADGTADYCVTTATDITIDVVDDGCCGNLTVKWNNGTGWNWWNTSSNQSFSEVFQFAEECEHWLNVTAYDCLGHVTYYNSTFNVDDTTPAIDIEIGNPNVTGDGTPDYWVNFSTPITLNVTDSGCCQNMTVMWNNGTGWNIIHDEDAPLAYETSFSYTEECQHWLNVTAYDCLGNYNTVNLTIYVDNSPPESNLSFDEYCQNVTASNPLPIGADATDYPEECASGVANVTMWYRYARYNNTFTQWFSMGRDEVLSWEWSFDAPNGSGYYQFYTAAYDNLGQHEPYPPNATTEPKARLSVSYNHTFDLWHNTTGWNFVTVPVKQPGIRRAGDLVNYINQFSPDACTVVVRWDRDTQRYYSYIAGGSEDHNFSIVPGESYWVFVKHNISSLYMEGCLHEYDDINLTLKAGYNFLGWANIEDTTAKNLTGNISGATVMSKWNATAQRWFEPSYTSGSSPVLSFDIPTGECVVVFRPEAPAIYWDGGRDMLSLPPP